MALKQYRTVKDALWALARDCIVDEVDNQLPRRVVDALLRRARMDEFSWAEHFEDEWPKPRVAYRIHEGREVAWFSAGP